MNDDGILNIEGEKLGSTDEVNEGPSSPSESTNDGTTLGLPNPLGSFDAKMLDSSLGTIDGI